MKAHLQKAMALSFIVLSSGIFAGGADYYPLPYHGFYAGVDLGVNSLMDKQKTTNPVIDKHHLSAVGIDGGGLIGYDFTLYNRFKLGVEGAINGTSVSASANQDYAPASSYVVNMRYIASLRALPGYEFTPGTVGYFLIGYAYGNFKIKDNGDFGFVNKQFGRNGFQCGLGMKTPVYKNLSIRGDLIYTTYASQNTNGLTTSSTGTQTYYNNLSTFEGLLSLIYKFS